MNTFYVKDLRKFFEQNTVSPEVFAEQTKLSHMTIRRWLKKRDNEELPHKYSPILGPLFLKTMTVEIPKFSVAAGYNDKSMDDIMVDLKNMGAEYSSSADTLEKEVSGKLSGLRLDKIFTNYCKRLIQIVRFKNTPFKVKAVCIGALLYFINPIDLIPDQIPIIGYLDDLAVLSIALNYALTYQQTKNKKEA